jgi:aromatic ring-opening dioxygenase catalytic subunit (LigB family)
MADLAGVFATCHAPPLVRDWDAIEPSSRRELSAAFSELGQRIAACSPDTMIMIGADHWASFFVDNYPAICLGVGEEHGGPPERWLTDYPHHRMPGDPALGAHIAETAFACGFEPSLSHNLRLDHAFCVPIWKAGISPLLPLVPIVINALQPPFPTIERCLEFGRMIARAIDTYERPSRIAILATGGLSHSVGEPQMGRIDEAFDRECIELFQRGDKDALVRFLRQDRIDAAGNGSNEVRFWVAAHGAATARRFQLIHYEAVPETYTGCAFAEWMPEA